MKWIEYEVWGSSLSDCWEKKYTIFGFCVWTTDIHKLLND